MTAVLSSQLVKDGRCQGTMGLKRLVLKNPKPLCPSKTKEVLEDLIVIFFLWLHKIMVFTLYTVLSSEQRIVKKEKTWQHYLLHS